MNFIRQICSSVKNAYNIDMGLDGNGNDVVVYQNLSNCNIMTHRLSDGLVTKVLDGSKISKATTISCRNIKRPGWAYFGDFEAGPGSVAEYHAAGVSEPGKASYNTVFALKLDGSETVQVFGHMHHSTNEGLYVQPMPVPSPDGKKVLFASDWEEEDMSVSYVGGPFKYTRVYDYVAEYLAPTIPGGFEATNYNSGSLTICWKPSLDDDSGIQYEVYNDGILAGTTTDTSMVLTGLSASTEYTITVKAKNSNGDISPSSEPYLFATSATYIPYSKGINGMMKVSVYPNPMTDHSAITISTENCDDFTVSIYDLTGKKVIEKQFFNTKQEIIGLKTFHSKSIYIVKVVNSKNQVVIRKLIQK